jgi:hypothetical protein
MRNEYTDITANKHKGNKQSQAANIKVAPYKLGMREKILGFMAIRDEQGLGTSCRHAADHFGKEGGQIGGRFTELKAEEIIEPTGITENGYMVYRLAHSTKVATETKDVVQKTLTVNGPGITGEILFEKTTGGWQIAAISPNLASIVEGTPVDGIKQLLLHLGFTYSWDHEEIKSFSS